MRCDLFVYPVMDRGYAVEVRVNDPQVSKLEALKEAEKEICMEFIRERGKQ